MPEAERTKLIGELAELVRSGDLPEPARSAGLTLIGWLARRRPEEEPSSGAKPATLRT